MSALLTVYKKVNYEKLTARDGDRDVLSLDLLDLTALLDK